MNEVSHAEKIGKTIAKALDTVHWSPEFVAMVLSKQPGVIQFRLWQLVQALIGHWAIAARYQDFDTQYMEVYKWAERKSDD